MREKKTPTWNKTGKRNSKMNPGYGALQGSGGEEPDPDLQRTLSPLRFWMSVSLHPVPPLAPLPQDSTNLFTIHPYRRCPNQQLKQLQVPDYTFRTHYWSVCCMSVMISIPVNPHYLCPYYFMVIFVSLELNRCGGKCLLWYCFVLSECLVNQFKTCVNDVRISWCYGQ